MTPSLPIRKLWGTPTVRYDRWIPPEGSWSIGNVSPSESEVIFAFCLASGWLPSSRLLSLDPKGLIVE